MSTRRIVLVAGIAALLIGFIAQLIPLSTSDGSDGSINCGNGLSSDLSAARTANNSIAGVPVLNEVLPHTDYLAQRQSKLSVEAVGPARLDDSAGRPRCGGVGQFDADR